MANFKHPTTNAGISTVAADASGRARFRLWGGGPDKEELIVRVYRSDTVVSEGLGVTLERTDAGDWNFDYTATGLKQGDQIFGLTNTGLRYTAALSVVAAGAVSKNDLIASWAAHWEENHKPSSDYLYPGAVPYLALKHPPQAMPTLAEKCIGGSLSKVNGLAVHCTAGGLASAFNMAAWHCVQTWNASNGASAHFGISGDGKVVQFISTDRIANAQHDPGNLFFISVEVANTGKTIGMNDVQLTALKQLWSWVRMRFLVPNVMGTGYLGDDPKMNALTRQVCAAAPAPVTYDPVAPAHSQGLSCHHWLDKGRKPCPGLGILGQLPSVLKPGLVS